MVFKTFFALDSPIFWKGRGEEDGECKQTQLYQYVK